MAEQKRNLRFELFAYERTDVCRLAAILTELIGDDGGASRDAIAARWAVLHPRHAQITGKGRIRSRISKCMGYLVPLGLVGTDGDKIIVKNREWLEMATANLAIVQDQDGIALPPSEWERRPQAPEELRPVQQMLAERPPQG